MDPHELMPASDTRSEGAGRAGVRSAADLLREYLSQTSVSCPNCRYSLRGLASDRCPECNMQLELRVALTSQRVGQLIAAIVPLAAVGGAAAIMTALVIVISIIERSWPSTRESLVLLISPPCIAILLGVPLSVLMRERGRRWFRERTGHAAALVVGGAWGVSLMLLGGWTTWLIIEVL